MEVNRSPELEERARESHAAFEARDNDWFRRSLGEGQVIAFGTAPDEVFRGREAILGLTVDEIAELNERAGIKLEIDETEAYEAGDAGWILTHAHFVLSDGSSVPTRSLTVVFREDGEWKTGISGISVVVGNDVLTPGSPIATRAGAAAG